MIVVVGASGFIARRLVERLKEAGRPVICVTHNPERARLPGYRYGDIRAPETLPEALAGAEIVVQSTQFPGYPIPKAKRGWTYLNYDGIGSERLVDAAVQAGAKRYVYVSGVGVGESDPRPYFAAIRRAEQAVQGSGLQWACVRPAFVYGPHDQGLNKLIRWARASPALPFTGGDARHQPVHIDDVAEVLWRCCALDGPQGVFEVAGPEEMTMREVLRSAFAAAGVRCLLVPVPKLLARTGAAVLERAPGELLAPSAIDFICEDFVGDNRRVREELGLRLTRFEEGIRYLRTDKAAAAAPAALA